MLKSLCKVGCFPLCLTFHLFSVLGLSPTGWVATGGSGSSYYGSLACVMWSAAELAHDLRFLASVVSQSFLAFGDIMELYRKFLELSGGITRVSELEELLCAAQHGEGFTIFVLQTRRSFISLMNMIFAGLF